MDIVLCSKDVAEVLGKRHDNLLREIRNLVKKLGEEAVEYFRENPKNGSRGSTFSVTRAGCELLGSRLLGDAGREYKEWCEGVFGASKEATQEEVAVEETPEPAVKEYTFQEVADMLGISERSVRRYIEAGKLEMVEREVMIPTVKKFITEEALEAFNNGRDA